jgi:hypothetical protein
MFVAIRPALFATHRMRRSANCGQPFDDREKEFAYFSAPLILTVSTAAAKQSMSTDLRADARPARAEIGTPWRIRNDETKPHGQRFHGSRHSTLA